MVAQAGMKLTSTARATAASSESTIRIIRVVR